MNTIPVPHILIANSCDTQIHPSRKCAFDDPPTSNHHVWRRLGNQSRLKVHVFVLSEFSITIFGINTCIDIPFIHINMLQRIESLFIINHFVLNAHWNARNRINQQKMLSQKNSAITISRQYCDIKLGPNGAHHVHVDNSRISIHPLNRPPTRYDGSKY